MVGEESNISLIIIKKCNKTFKCYSKLVFIKMCSEFLVVSIPG